jgi:hypothetical protein
MAFSKDEDKEHTWASNKGPYDKSQFNDQTIESPLKKTKKKIQEKTLIAQSVFVSTKTRVVDTKNISLKHGHGRTK